MVGTLDSLSLKNTKLGLETLGLMEYDPKKIQLVLNRADTRVGISQHDVVTVLGSEPNVFIPSDREIPRSVNEGIPIILSRPQSYAATSFHELAAHLHRRRANGEPVAAPPVGRLGPRALPVPVPLQEEVAAWSSTSVSSPPSPALPPPAKEPFADLKNPIHMLVIGELGPQLTGQTLDPVGMRDRVIADIRRHLSGETGISRDDRERLLAEIADDILGYGPLERLLADDSITEIMVNGPGEIWIERQGRLYETTVRFSDDSHLRRIINRMVAQIGRRIDESSPMVDARLPDGSRVNAIISPLSLSGPLLTIRKFSRKRLGLQDMVNLGSLSEESVDFLRRCIQAQLNILISGGTGSGKTTLLNALSSSIPDHERIVTIEDAAELQLHQRHVLRLEARPPNIEGEGAIPIRDLVRNSLRMRPDRIIVGECRGPEALDMLQAMNTGHDGSLSTVHANAPRDALARIETMVLMVGLRPAGAGDPPAGLLGARHGRPHRAHGGRLAPCHGGHRGAAHGVRRDHAAGHLRVQDRLVRAGRHDQRQAPADGSPPGLPRQVREARDRPAGGPVLAAARSHERRGPPTVSRVARLAVPALAALLVALVAFPAAAAATGASRWWRPEARCSPTARTS